LKAPQYTFCPVCARPLITKTDGGLDRKACPDESCGFIFYNNPAPVLAAVVEYEGDLLLVQNKGWPGNWFGLLTGFLEENEKPESGIIREVKEEVGLDAEVQSLIGVYGFSMLNQLIVAYHVKASGTIVIGDELEAVKRISPEKVIAWPYGTGEALQDWLRSRGIEPKVVDPFKGSVDPV
jgi:NADH pyrophosphatase NudC (nudix superfamily)